MLIQEELQDKGGEADQEEIYFMLLFGTKILNRVMDYKGVFYDLAKHTLRRTKQATNPSSSLNFP